MRLLTGHFDGKVVVLDEPSDLPPNTKVRVIPVTPEQNEAELSRAFAKVSEPAFQKIWDNPLDAEYDRL